MTPQEAVDEFEKIIPKFIKNFSVERVGMAIRKSLLTKTEINVLNAYAIAQHKAQNANIAIEILYEIEKYIHSHVADREGIAIVYTKILYNLSRYVGMAGDDEEALELAEKGIKNCIRYNRYRYLPDLLYNKGYALMQLGREAEAHKSIQECYYLCRTLGKMRTRELEVARKFAEKHGIKLV
jgi:tetratricopeptide (TPR) repeat protein